MLSPLIVRFKRLRGISTSPFPWRMTFTWTETLWNQTKSWRVLSPIWRHFLKGTVFTHEAPYTFKNWQYGLSHHTFVLFYVHACILCHSHWTDQTIKICDCFLHIYLFNDTSSSSMQFLRLRRKHIVNDVLNAFSRLGRSELLKRLVVMYEGTFTRTRGCDFRH